MSELARALGCEVRLDARTGAFTADRNCRGRNSVDGVWVAGDGGGIGGAQVAQAMGALAGLDAARSLGHARATDAPARRHERALRRHERFQRSLWRIFGAPRLVDQLAEPSTVVCRCEEVTLGELTAATTPWLAGAGSLKRVTRAGMGKCQGRYCGPLLTELARRSSGEPVGPRSGFAPQAPCLPLPVAALVAPETAAAPSAPRPGSRGLPRAPVAPP